MPAADRLPDPPALEGYTRLTGELGGGGATSLVYKERCERTGEAVAVKYMPRAELRAGDSSTSTIERELRNHALAVHQHIAGFREVKLMAEWVAVVSELCEGHNLLTWLNMQPERRATEAVARGVISQIMAAVQHMHCVGMVHRDLKVRTLRAHPRAACAPPRGVLRALRRHPLRSLREVPRPTTSAWRGRPRGPRTRC